MKGFVESNNCILLIFAGTDSGKHILDFRGFVIKLPLAIEMESAVVGPQKRRGRKRKRPDVQNVTENCNSKKKVLETRSLKLVGRFVRKEFQNSGVFLGKIVSYDSGLYRINYEDGDCEDLDSGEVKAFLVDCCDLIGMWSERKEKLDDLLRKNVNSKILEVEKPAEPVDANQVDLSLLSGLDNGEAGAKEVEEVLALVDTEADSSSDSCEDAREHDSNIDMEVPLVPPPELPLSSGHIGVPEEYVSHLLSVYSLLRSFSVPLFLYPFGLDEFVGALNSPVANTLLDAVHVALMHVVKRHLERLSSDGSELALKCLRCLDWSLLDALTWPVYLVHYLLVMGHINGPDWKGFYTHSLERDYYTLLAGKKLMVLQILCDDVLDSEELRAEMDVREESEVGIDLDTSTVFASTCGPRRVHPRYSKTSACKDRDAIHGIAEHHEKSSVGHPVGSPVGAPLGSSAVEDGNGDECRLCGMDGFLLCCDGCPSSYHSRCLGLNKMYMPEGSWYCPECKINSSEPEILRGTQLRGGDICGVDPYEQAFVATCGHLLVIKASVNSRICLRYYNRHDIPRVLHALYSKAEHATMYSEICREIMQHWELPENILPLNEISENGLSLANRNECGECNTQLVDLSGKLVPEMTEVDNTGSCVTGINSAEATSCHTNCFQEPLLSGNFSYAMIENDQLGTILTGQPADSCKFSQQSISSVAETVSNVRNNNCPVNGDSLTYTVPLPYLELNNSVDRKYGGRSYDNCSYMGTLFKSTDYINYYLHGDFAASAAANLAILSSEENQVPESCSSYNRRKIMSASVSLQLNAFSSAATRFFWPNTEKKLVEVPRERCSWCFSCKAPVSSRRGCLLNAAASNAIKGAMKLVSSVRPVKNGDGRLSGIATYIMFMEESLSGLIVGPFLNDSFRKRWRKQVERASTGNAIKLLLLELEENIRSIALSEDWMKLVDGFTSQPPPASQKVASAAGPIQKRKPGRRGRKASTTVQVAIDDCQDTLTDFTWWRGGIQSKLIFPGGFLPGSLIKKAARQGGSKKIPRIHYVEGQETPKTTRQLLWRSAVEMSRSTAQLAHRVRCLDFHVRWADLVRPEQIVSDGKGPETEASAFRNAFISDKKSVEGEIRYCVAFGNQKHLPSRVMKNITEIEQVLDDSKELYWFSETHIPLYLIKEYEEKVEKGRPVDVLSKLQRRQLKTSNKNIFSYLSRKLDTMERNYCCSCHQVVLYRSAVKCRACQGFCHEQCATSTTVHVNEEVEFFITCKRCCEAQVVTRVESSNGSPTSPLLLQGQDFPNADATNKSGKSVGYKGSSASVRISEHSSEVKSVSRTSVTKKSKIKHWGLIWRKKNCEDTGIDFRLKNILLRGNPDVSLTKPLCRLCNQPYNADLMYIRCETCQYWYHADAVELEESKIFCLVGFKCCKCRRIRSPVCPCLDPEKKKVLEDKIERKQVFKQDISGMETAPGVMRTNEEVNHVSSDDPHLFSLSDVEQGAEDKSKMDYGQDNAIVSAPGPRKLPVRRHIKQENGVDYPYLADPFQVEISAPFETNVSNFAAKLPFRRNAVQENSLDCYSATNSFQFAVSDPLEANAMNTMQNSLSPQVQLAVSKDSFDDGITLDYDCLGYDEMEFEPQTYFSFNELLASDDDGRANGNESLENATENWENSSLLVENATLEISYDLEEPTISVETAIPFAPCKMCSHTEPCPDLCCQICGMWIHNHCSPWVESSWENGWRCGNCREWR